MIENEDNLEKEVTFGELLINDFHTCSDDRVSRLKEIFAEAIDIIQTVESDFDHVNDYVTYATHKIIEAELVAVKSLNLK